MLKKKPKTPGVRSEEEETKMRQKVREFIDGKLVTVIMTCVTLWALFGDDIRMLATDKPVDDYFFVSFMISLCLFVIELFLTSLVVDDYKYSFFFWLDFIAAISLIPDIPYIVEPFVMIYGGETNSANVTVKTTGNQNVEAANIAARMLKSFRLIRLVRIVKLYKYFTKRETEEQEARLREAQKKAQNARQAAMNREMDPTRLGKRLSDTITRRVIIVVLLMIIFLPIMQAQQSDTTPYYGLQQLFWMGRSSCNKSDDFMCNPEHTEWLSVEGWYDLLYRYSKCTEENDEEEPEFSLLWLRLPDFIQDGEVKDIKIVPNSDPSKKWDDPFWEQDDDCADYIVSEDCSLRDSEMKLIVYIPEMCIDEDVEGCEVLQAYARFDVKSSTQQEALINIVMTIFVGIILAVASITFTIDTQKIVIGPITKMVLVIKSLADDPLKKPEYKLEDRTYDDMEERLREDNTSLLQETIFKIGSLLQISFGEDGAKIIARNMTGEGELNLMRPGTKVSIIIGIAKIQNFTKILDCLDEEATIYMNKIGKVIHECCEEWSGLSAKNGHGEFYIIWRLPDITDKDRDEDDLSNPVMQRTDLANRALVAFLKVFAEIRRSPEINAYKVHPKIVANYGQSFNTDLNISLHIGWGVEGVIGSENKIDPAYLSPHVSLGIDMLKSIAEYRVSMIMSEEFYGYLSVKAKSCCRRIDTVFIKYINSNNPFGIYTFDISKVELPAPEDHTIGQLIKVAKFDSVNVKSFQHKGVDYMFTLDSDIVALQSENSSSFYKDFRHAYVNYMSGAWDVALEYLDKALTTKQDDGPVLSIKKYIQSFSGKPPENWPRARPLL
jgi:hypothetical protein